MRDALSDFRSIEIVGPFNLVAQHNDDGSFEACSCSCGWRLDAMPISDSEVVHACVLHNAEHENYVKVLKLYKEGTIFYDGALSFLTMLGMNEDRAEALLDG